MATIAMIGGVAITIPGILSGAWSTLKFAYDLYGQIDMRRTQVKLLLDRSSDLICAIAQAPFASDPNVTKQTQGNIRELQTTLQLLQDAVSKLKRKSLLWCVVNQDDIDTTLADVRIKIDDAFLLFHIKSGITIEKFQRDLLQAQAEDATRLNLKLDELSQNDQQILNVLKGQEGAQHRAEEILVSVLKEVQRLGADQSNAEAKFLRKAGAALQSSTRGYIPDIASDYVITTLEVDFQERDIIGKGAFGRVYKGQWNGARVAIKQMHMDSAEVLSERDRRKMFREIRLWKELHHPNILQLFGACLEAKSPFLVMPYCPAGSMCRYLAGHPEANRANISYDIVTGMVHLHSQNIVHADLKGMNILIEEGGSIYKARALVTDFGLSAAIDDIRSRSGQTSTTHVTRGTPQWMAPECHKGEPPQKPSDVYSLGLTIWEAFSGEIPFAGLYGLGLGMAVTYEHKRPERPPLLTEDGIWSIITKCWATDASQRPTMKQVMSMLTSYTTRLDSTVQDESGGRPWSPQGAAAIATPPFDHNSPHSLSQSSRFQSEWGQSLSRRPPEWKRGNPPTFIDQLTIPDPPLPEGKEFAYRVVTGDADLGTRKTYERAADGSQKVNLLEYNKGFGISDKTSIKVFALAEDDPAQEEVLVARWN